MKYMKKRKLVILALCMVLAFSLAACGRGYGGQLRI